MASETSIDFLSNEKFITYFSNVSSEMKYMRTLIGKDGVELRFDESNKEDGGIELRIPKKWYKRPRPPKKKELTEEHKQALLAGLAKSRAKRKSVSDSDEDNDDE